MMDFTSWTPLLWLLLLIGVAVGFHYTLVDRPRGLMLGAFLLRVLGIVLLVLALCQPFVREKSDEAHIVFMVDVSQSVDLASAKGALDQVDAGVKKLRQGDSSTLFAMADGLREKPLADFRTMLESWDKGLADDAFRAHSKIGESLLAARLAFPSGKARRLIVFTDGVDTEEKTEASLEQLRDEDVDVLFVPLKGLTAPEAALVGLDSASSLAFHGEVLRLTARVVTNQPMNAKVRLLNKGVAVQEKEVELKPGQEARVWFDTEMNTPGPTVWSAELVPAKDHFAVNNHATTTITVKGKPRLLVIHEDERKMRLFTRALKEQDFDVDLRGKRGLPDTMEELLSFDAVMIANLSATDMTPRQMNLLRRYVADFGGGLIMTGSENSFGLGGYYKTPVEEVLPLISRFEKEKEKPSLAMVLVIDKSGSMQGLPMELARQAAKSAAELLGQQDQIAVIGFDGDAQVFCELTSASQQGTIQAAIDSMEASGGTNMYPGMVLGKEMLERTSAKVKHMICLTDGQTQDADHLGLTQEMVNSGVTVSSVGLGEGAARELLQQIADVGRGRYYESNDPQSLPQIFTKETAQASKSAVQEGLFQPVGITEHPMLAGYDADGLPVILGYVMTEAKPSAQVLLAAEQGDPMLAVGRFGLGIGLAYTSDLTENWGGEWLVWDGCGAFWAQVLRGALRKADTEGVTVRDEVNHGEWVIDVDRRGEDASPLNHLQWKVQTLDQNGNTQDIKMLETGLGRYQARLPLGSSKHLSLRLHDTTEDKLEVRHYHAPYPAEYRLDGEVPDALTTLPTYYVDRLLANLPVASQPKPAGHWFSWLGLLCLLGGLILRRV
ncbi:VWA domain-containing protein [Phragmitibacter flavus]|uniref:VWA domain-containing protein n=1 Tax=Phragmitibacter flavus TaxID=2576071 RepID=A0A5R8KDU6_9BACT|nr:VWA domain-containing protein [Phragmitibacter flavus]TLD70115.1 VWA domain-containing protein [Phragmitibacter flavus]